MQKTKLVCLSLVLMLLGAMAFPVPVHAGIGVNPSSLSFGSVTVGTASAPATVVVTNNSGQPVSILQVSSGLAEFVVLAPAMPITLSPHASTSFQVIFNPDAAVTFSGSISVSSSRKAGTTQPILVSGIGILSPATSSPTYLLSASTSSLNFGNGLVGTPASQSVSFTNTGTGSVNISQAAITGSGFTASGFSGAMTLAAGQSFGLTVSFAPIAAGSVTGSLSVVSNATNSPSTISLSGKGVQPQITVIPSSVSFSNVTVGVTNTQMLTISNPGTANLSVSQAMLGGTGFSFSGLALPLSLPPGGSSTFTVAFNPPAAVSYSGSLTLVNNTPNSPLNVTLGGTGVSAIVQLSASPTSLNFGTITPGTSAMQSVTLTNTGNSSVSLSQISASGAGFSDSGFAMPLTLAAGQSTSLNATFAPTTSGSFSGRVTVTSNAANSPLAVTLSGSGTAPVSHTVSLDWTPGISSYEGFNVYRGTASGGPYARVNSALISATSFIDSGVASGQTYYYVATELDLTGMESLYSSEIIAAIP
jgi:hypothetical protein